MRGFCCLYLLVLKALTRQSSKMDTSKSCSKFNQNVSVYFDRKRIFYSTKKEEYQWLNIMLFAQIQT